MGLYRPPATVRLRNANALIDTLEDEIARLTRAVEDLVEMRKRALALVEAMSTDVPQRHKLRELLCAGGT